MISNMTATAALLSVLLCAACGPSGSWVDYDGDGAPASIDCDDSNPDVRPDRREVCDGLDTDCDPATDEDADFDGDGYTTCEGDCVDFASFGIAFGPQHIPMLTSSDRDCDGTEDYKQNNVPARWGMDADGDGQSPREGDCDDTDNTTRTRTPNADPDAYLMGGTECGGIVWIVDAPAP